MRTKMNGYVSVLVCAVSLLSARAAGQSFFRHPQPGDIYREYSRTMNSYSDWRVTDPNAGDPRAQANLPNKTLSLTIGDLQGAIRAEALIDLWQGHAGTTGKAIRFNNNSWISIPDLSTPPTSGECYLGQYNVVVDIPLAHLVQGGNTFQGTNSGQTCYDFDWGQHGMNGIVVRIYYDASKAHPTGTITSPSAGQNLSEDPTVTATASGPAAIKQVNFIAYYNGPDTDGDGIYQDWQYNYHRAKSETAMKIKGHVGSDTTSPYGVTWSTALVPDQAAGSIKLVARIQDVNGIWFVTDEVTGLSLQRVGKAVRLYKAAGVPERFSIRLTRETRTCTFSIPSSEKVADATAATMLISSYNGIDGSASIGSTFYTRVNSWTTPTYGADHFYSLDYLTVPPAQLKSGSNTYTIFCNDSSTGIWIHWPGPQMVVTFTGDYASPAPAAPALLSPSNASSDVPPSTSLRWAVSGSATSYRVQVALDAGFTSLVVDDSTVTDTVKAVSGLSFETVHYWRVRAKNSAGVSAFSPAWSFTTSAGAPVLVAPPDGSTDLTVPVTMRWRAQSGALAYWLQVSADSLFRSFAVNDSTVLDTFRVVGGLTGSQPYYWRVRNRTISGPGVFSPAWSFATNSGAPVLVAPADGTTDQPEPVTLRWRPVSGALTYLLQLSTDSLFEGHFAVNDSTLADTFLVAGDLEGSMTYHWRVRNSTTPGAVFSPAWSFTTILSLPAAVELAAPADQEVIAADSVRFAWELGEASVTRYWLEIGFDPAFQFKTIDSSLTDTTKLVHGLVNNNLYSWRMRAFNAAGWGPYSVVRQFRPLYTGIGDEPGLPTEYSLSQNYPNPFNPSTQIMFGLPTESRVTLELFNTLGELVMTVLDGTRAAGYHTVTVDASTLSAGLYLYRLTAGDKVMTRKMLLVK